MIYGFAFAPPEILNNRRDHLRASIEAENNWIPE